MDRPPPPGFEWERLGVRRVTDLPFGELQRIDDVASRPTDEQGGLAADALAHPGMGLEFVPAGMRTVWGRVTGAYTVEGSGMPLYTWRPILHAANVAVDQDAAAPDGVALETLGNVDVPTDGSVVVPFWLGEDSVAGAAGEKWRFVYGGVGPPGTTVWVPSPAATLATDTNDLAVPAGATVVPLAASSQHSLTGAATADDAVILWTNTGPATVLIPNQSTSSSAPDRWTIPGGGTLPLPPNASFLTWKEPGNGNVVITTFLGIPVVGTGLAGGQTITGGTASGDPLTLIATSNATPGTVAVQTTSSATSTVVENLKLVTQSTGTAAAGLGSSLAYYAENASNTSVKVMALDAVYTDAAAGSEDADAVFRLAKAGALAEGLRVYGLGGLAVPAVASSLGTPAAGSFAVYAKTDGKIYGKNDAGTEYDLTATGGGSSPFTEGTLAATGSVQGNAAALSAFSTEVTGADGTKGVILPSAALPMMTVWNNSTSNLKVYPHSGATINTGSANVNITMSAKASLVFYRVGSTHWFSGAGNSST